MRDVPPAGYAPFSVPPPATPIYRLTKLGRDPFILHPNASQGEGRFDAPDRGFRTLYCATTREAAFGETIVGFRRAPSLLLHMADVDEQDESVEEALVGLIDMRDRTRGVVPADWRFQRQIGVTTLAPHLRCVDFAHQETLAYLREALAETALALGYTDFDFSDLIGTNRAFTQRCASHVYDLYDADDHPRFAGIRFMSRWGIQRWECWALFADRLQHTPGEHEVSIRPDDPDLRAAARVHNLSIELLHSHDAFDRP